MNTVILTPDAVRELSVSNNGLYVDLDRGPWQIRNSEHMLDTINNNTDPEATVTISITIKLSDIHIFGQLK
jgi:hypothetical protein